MFLVLNQQINEYTYRYDDICNKSDSFVASYCQINITIDADLTSPIYFYYELNNYFQNHRVYLESRNDEQLQGTYKTSDQLDSCIPITLNKDVHENLTNLNGEKLDPNDPATPCGLIAQTLFTG